MKRYVFFGLPLLVGPSVLCTRCHGFVFSKGDASRSAPIGLESSSFPRPSSFSSSTKRASSQDVGEMRMDIDRMKKEAIRRLDALNQKMHEADLEASARIQAKQSVVAVAETPLGDEGASPATSLKGVADYGNANDDAQVQALVDMADAFDQEMRKPVADIGNAAVDTSSAPSQAKRNESGGMPNVKPLAIVSPRELRQQRLRQHPLKLLDKTRWRVMLNIGREPGTWMTKTWGVSGDRLYLNVELEFTPDQLYERDDFFNGVSGSKVLHVIHNEASLAPSMMEGGRRVRVKNGGWRVVPGEGPMGTTVVRFFFDVEEETRHRGSDVYLPSGRVYCTCGYFPMAGRSNADGCMSSRELMQKEVHELEMEYQGLQNANAQDENIFSMDKLKRAKEMMDIRREAAELTNAIQLERVREPEKSLLRLSQDQSVGLTREGGVCCKRQKGVAVEYHILGKFEIASMENREHSDYRKLLP